MNVAAKEKRWAQEPLDLLLRKPLINDWKRSNENGLTVDALQSLGVVSVTSVNRPDVRSHSRLTLFQHPHHAHIDNPLASSLSANSDSRRSASFTNPPLSAFPRDLGQTTWRTHQLQALPTILARIQLYRQYKTILYLNSCLLFFSPHRQYCCFIHYSVLLYASL